MAFPNTGPFARIHPASRASDVAGLAAAAASVRGASFPIASPPPALASGFSTMPTAATSGTMSGPVTRAVTAYARRGIRTAWRLGLPRQPSIRALMLGRSVVRVATPFGPLQVHARRLFHYVEPYEAATCSFLQDRLRPGDFFVDAGACVGFFSAVAHSAVGPGGTVVAIEPDRANFALLESNMDARGRPVGRELYRVAIGDRPGWSEFHTVHSPDSHGFWSHPQAQTVGKDRVYTDTLDNIVAGFAPRAPDAVKLDVEGAEVIALDGFQKTLAASPPRLMVVEIYPASLRMAGTSHGALIDRLESAGYRLRMVPNHSQVAGPVDMDVLDGADDVWFGNLWAEQ